MKWRVDKKPHDCTEWHLWFAWKPVQIGNYMYWLCLLYRRVKFTYVTPRSEYEKVLKSGKDFKWEYHEADYY